MAKVKVSSKVNQKSKSKVLNPKERSLHDASSPPISSPEPLCSKDIVHVKVFQNLSSKSKANITRSKVLVSKERSL
jgi:hypothetical protein